MKKLLAIAFVAFAALFVVPYWIVIAVAAIAVAIGLWKGAFDSSESSSPGSSIGIGGPSQPLDLGTREYADLGPSVMPASMTKFRGDDDLSIR
jgi:hypothetical protein